MTECDRIIETLSDSELSDALRSGWIIGNTPTGRRQRALVKSGDRKPTHAELVKSFASIIATNLKTFARVRPVITVERRKQMNAYAVAYHKARPWIRKRYDRSGHRKGQQYQTGCAA